MKTKILIAVLSIGLFAVSTVKAQEKAKMKVEQAEKVAYACPMQCEGEKTYDKTGSCPKCKMDLKKAEIKIAEMYACPMHADIKSDKPGACPKCGMDLKKMEMKMNHSKMNHDKMAEMYVCPMHADVTSDKPGSCPKCGMDFKEKKMEMKK